MMAAGNYYPYCCMPEDVWAAMGKDRENMLFIDVQARGYYPAYGKKMFEKLGVHIDMTPEDERILRENTVDFISFSYYSSGASLRRRTWGRPLEMRLRARKIPI